MPDSFVTLILLNYNSSRFTFPCVESIRSTCLSDAYEIIVVDNNSSTDDFERLKPIQNQPRLRLVRSRLNLGFAGGNMLGVQFARPETTHYFFLNNDCVLLNDVCGILRQFLDAHPDVGVCTAQMVDEKGRLQPSFGYFPTLAQKWLGHGLLRQFSPKAYPSDKAVYDQPVRVPVVTGSALFVRADAFNAVGGLETAYFLYCEEEDLCQRLKRRGFSAALVPEARFVHYGGESTNRNLAIEKEFYISLFHYYRQFHPVWQRPLFRLFFFLKNLRKFYRHPNYAKLAWFILKGSPQKESLRYRQVIR